jgi:NAD(P)-dependent dehydrogenase (short-subunit alcohol dehydrogenase family)
VAVKPIDRLYYVLKYFISITRNHMNTDPRQRILITGASRGIGRELALQYSKKGARLFLLARNTQALGDVCRLINQSGGDARYQGCDVTSREDVRKAVEAAAAEFGGIDLAILNSGISNIGWFENYNTDNLVKTVETNLFGVAYAMENLIPIMKKQGHGTIAAVSSLADTKAYPGSSSYSASKIALSYILSAARAELKEFGIRVITIRPGFTRTDRIKKNNFFMPFTKEPSWAAKTIIKGIGANKRIISFPITMSIITSLIKLIPDRLFDFSLYFRRKQEADEQRQLPVDNKDRH